MKNEEFYCEIRRLAQFCQLGVMECNVICEILTRLCTRARCNTSYSRKKKPVAEAVEFALKLELSIRNMHSIESSAGPAGGITTSFSEISRRGAGRPTAVEYPDQAAISVHAADTSTNKENVPQKLKHCHMHKVSPFKPIFFMLPHKA